MASGPQLTASTSNEGSAQHEYFRVLGALSPKDIEDRIVMSLRGALSEMAPHSNTPVRLSMVADRFLVKPEPRLVRGNYDGEIEFDSAAQRFVITLCTDCPERPFWKLPNQTRLRFTYAHEMAHRFFYVRRDASWVRARDIATEKMRLSDQMEQRITLGRLEERLCNKIAARVLIPDTYISDGCDLGDWFSDNEQFYVKLASEAKSLGVSRDCLLVRLRETESRSRMGPHVALMVGRSAGPMNRRSAFTLRVLTALSPSQIEGRKLPAVYPGMEVEKLGQAAAKFVSDILNTNTQMQGRVQLPLLLGNRAKSIANLDGCWRVLSAQGARSDGDYRILLWGRVTLA